MFIVRTYLLITLHISPLVTTGLTSHLNHGILPSHDALHARDARDRQSVRHPFIWYLKKERRAFTDKRSRQPAPKLFCTKRLQLLPQAPSRIDSAASTELSMAPFACACHKPASVVYSCHWVSGRGRLTRRSSCTRHDVWSVQATGVETNV